MMINGCLILFICHSLLNGRYQDVDFDKLGAFGISGVLEMIMFDTPILALLGVI